jgi:flagellar protein FliS
VHPVTHKANNMFGSDYSASPFGGRNAYQAVQVGTGVDGASPHQLIAMLFDGLIDCIAQARGAIRAGKIEEKGRAISRAVRIVDEGLKAGLNLKEGGALAAQLNDLYAYMALRLTQANLRSDEAALDECVQLIEPLRSAWAQIDIKTAA